MHLRRNSARDTLIQLDHGLNLRVVDQQRDHFSEVIAIKLVTALMQIKSDVCTRNIRDGVRWLNAIRRVAKGFKLRDRNLDFHFQFAISDLFEAVGADNRSLDAPSDEPLPIPPAAMLRILTFS